MQTSTPREALAVGWWRWCGSLGMYEQSEWRNMGVWPDQLCSRCRAEVAVEEAGLAAASVARHTGSGCGLWMTSKWADGTGVVSTHFIKRVLEMKAPSATSTNIYLCVRWGRCDRVPITWLIPMTVLEVEVAESWGINGHGEVVLVDEPLQGWLHAEWKVPQTEWVFPRDRVVGLQFRDSNTTRSPTGR